MNISKLYHYLSILSIDVAAGSMICSLYIAKILNTTMPLVILMALGLTVWVIYTFDHLIDARSTSLAMMSERHAFHKKNIQPLSICLVLGVVTIAALLFEMPATTVLWGAALGCGVLAYFLAINLIRVKRLVYKELMIAVIYTCGLFLGPLSVYDGFFGWQHAMLFFQFVILALLNLLVFSFYDQEFDQKASFPSMVLDLGKSRSRQLIQALFCLEIGIVAGNFIVGVEGQWVFPAMIILLLAIYIFRNNNFVRRNYRWVGDGVFMAPVFYLA